MATNRLSRFPVQIGSTLTEGLSPDVAKCREIRKACGVNLLESIGFQNCSVRFRGGIASGGILGRGRGIIFCRLLNEMQIFGGKIPCSELKFGSNIHS